MYLLPIEQSKIIIYTVTSLELLVFFGPPSLDILEHQFSTYT
jgi:hypothetical protein